MSPREWDFTQSVLNEREVAGPEGGAQLIEAYRQMGGTVDERGLQLTLRMRKMHTINRQYEVGDGDPTYNAEQARAEMMQLEQNGRGYGTDGFSTLP